ncbi:hypothetical protein [Francisella tularensis]|nr:hypothetical protein [Francisella tularensis]MBD2809206.1 hypothetical protein [Francisella tularensis]
MTWGRQNTQTEGFDKMDYTHAQGIQREDTTAMLSIQPNAEIYGNT